MWAMKKLREEYILHVPPIIQPRCGVTEFLALICILLGCPPPQTDDQNMNEHSKIEHLQSTKSGVAYMMRK